MRRSLLAALGLSAAAFGLAAARALSEDAPGSTTPSTPVTRPAASAPAETAPASAPDAALAADEAAAAALAEEILSPAPTPNAPRGAMRLYAIAFAGYALADLGRADPAFAPRAAELVDRLFARALTPAATGLFRAGEVDAAGVALSASVVYRGHLLLLLLGRRGLGALAPEREALLSALARGLAEDFAATPGALLPSYGKWTWPADNELAAAALAIYLAQIGPDPAVAAGLEAASRALAALEAGGLPPSEVARGSGAALDVPRGCALSLTAALRAHRDLESARALYRRYREGFLVAPGPLLGFREWPRGVERPADADSGPILFGVGAAASALAIGATRLLGEEADHLALRAAARAAGLGAIEAARGRWLERAVALWGRSARPW